MKKLFIGFLFIFLDLNFNIGSSTVGFIPDFIGYIFLVSGLKELTALSPRFEKARPFALGMAVYCVLLYALDIFAKNRFAGVLSVVLGIVSVVISLYISYQIVSGIRDIQITRGLNLDGDRLMTLWKVLAVFQAIIYAALLIPALAVICVIVSFIVSIVFLVAFYNSKQLFEASPLYTPPADSPDGE